MLTLSCINMLTKIELLYRNVSCTHLFVEDVKKSNAA